ncbi:HupE/UreJ family protein [Pseudoduganella chitinolytica]|uniref:HupE/UreJ family protein n=1 Tax=Pseudoduganella chitinolytica TaxID=34070 RepID=A0ABY8BJD1_9BURK|nr:HupE/UreJ family protein [Pseudoduganella chitinolytica]WEF35031.1 HupE/UreJ family protein [Pseudoduganella chitinolytica]
MSARRLLLLGLCLPLPALAHPGHVDGAGFVAGLLHPLTGIDHLLALLAIGIWSARQPARLLPAVVVALAVGAGVGVAGLRLPALEGGIALSVLVAGALVAAAVRLPALAACAIMAGFALWHGNAHGLELSRASAIAGFLLASAALLMAGRWLGAWPRARVLGGAVAAAGFVLLAA